MALIRVQAVPVEQGTRAHRRPRPARSARGLAVLAMAGGLVLSACGGGGDDGPAAAPGPTLPSLDTAPPTTGGDAGEPPAPTTGVTAPSTAPSTARSVLPDLMVDDVGAGTKVNLASLVPSAQPVLVWFWAPH